ncbi:MAG: hypothetical protein PVS2B2_02350 [Candidatus Acidiferrum sp.]
MWKSVDNFLAPLQACSGCSGDYEDPDRTAWTDEEYADSDEHTGEAGGDEFLRKANAREEVEECGGN